VLAVEPTTRLVLETGSLANASPALLETVALVHVGHTVLRPSDHLHAWQLTVAVDFPSVHAHHHAFVERMVADLVVGTVPTAVAYGARLTTSEAARQFLAILRCVLTYQFRDEDGATSSRTKSRAEPPTKPQKPVECTIRPATAATESEWQAFREARQQYRCQLRTWRRQMDAHAATLQQLADIDAEHDGKFDHGLGWALRLPAFGLAGAAYARTLDVCLRLAFDPHVVCCSIRSACGVLQHSIRMWCVAAFDPHVVCCSIRTVRAAWPRPVNHTSSALPGVLTLYLSLSLLLVRTS
jgi:hypothetical protein